MRKEAGVAGFLSATVWILLTGCGNAVNAPVSQTTDQDVQTSVTSGQESTGGGQ